MISKLNNMLQTWNSARFTVLITLLSLIAIHLSPAMAAPASQLITCIDLQSGKERISKNGGCRVTQEATAIWHLTQSDSPFTMSASSKTLTICSNKESSSISYQIIRSKCARHQISSLYSRSTVLASKPNIARAVSFGHDSSQISLSEDPATNPDAPVTYYTIISNRGNSQKIYSWRELNLVISGLQALTTYTFTVTATTADGTSPVSAESIAVTTPAYVPPAPVATSSPNVPVLVAPAFNLSALAETVTVSTSATGFTIASNTGGSIASFAISATPAGMTFNTSTGALTGAPSTVATAISYTITGTNPSGTATRTFTLTVTAPVVSCADGGDCHVGDRGRGGGIVFYVAASNFTSAGSVCSTSCRYLEVASSTWQSGSAANDLRYRWSDIQFPWSGQDTLTVSTQGPPSNYVRPGYATERLNWQIGQGFNNTRLMKVDGATSTAQAAVLAYGGGAGSSTTGQWFIPSANELNELCKYARGQITGVTTDACDSTGTLKSTENAGTDLGGFVAGYYWSSTEGNWEDASIVYQSFEIGRQSSIPKVGPQLPIRPIRAF